MACRGDELFSVVIDFLLCGHLHITHAFQPIRDARSSG
jgi:hypothetical protein